jgi:saccharopine dehydrogenase (NAD+, L-lysine-forming)
VIADVTCDVTSPCNVLPIYDRAASWNRPVQRLCDDPRPLDIIALDNLPSLLPKEASAAFSAQLLPALLSLGCVAPAWQRCAQTFHEACKSTGLNKELADV